MAEYIEREAAIETIRSLYPSVPLVKLNIDKWHEKNKAYMECETAIEKLPAADVRPVVRGHWTTEHLASTRGGTYPVVRCSVCGASLPFFEGTTYCPNCGADMREES